MITCDYVRTMATYNRWQNVNLYSAAANLSDTRRREDLGAFFGSVHGTFSHLVWADKIWLSRFNGREAPRCQSIDDSVNECLVWVDMRREREGLDAEIVQWTEAISSEEIAGNLTWFSGAANREITKPRWLLMAHFFNHQTHHRGQIHALLTAMGQRPNDTDLSLMRKRPA